MAKKRARATFSFKAELLKKSKEAALSAVQLFNNPQVFFKSEAFIVLMVIAWTYLLHAHRRENGLEYKYFRQAGKRRRFDRTKHGAYKYWELERCLNDPACPLDVDVVNNLRFLIGLRHEIEHQMTTRIDDLLSARFQACCINYHEARAELFGDAEGIAKHLAVSLQFASLSRDQVATLDEHHGLPKHIRKYVEGFDGALSEPQYSSSKYAYRVIFVPKSVNHVGQADQVIQFVKAESAVAKTANAAYALIKETEKPKFLPAEIVKLMKGEGFVGFQVHHHAALWKSRDAKDSTKGFGVQIGKAWYWYASWVDEVRRHCEATHPAPRPA